MDRQRWTILRQSDSLQPYVSVWLKYVDQALWWLRFRPAYWSHSGHLCHVMPKGHGSEAGTHFPGWCWRAACRGSNWWMLQVARLRAHRKGSETMSEWNESRRLGGGSWWSAFLSDDKAKVAVVAPCAVGFTANYRGTQVGVFDTEEEAKTACELHHAQEGE